MIIVAYAVFSMGAILLVDGCDALQQKKSQSIKTKSRALSKTSVSRKIINIINTFERKKTFLKHEAAEQVITYTYIKRGEYTEMSIGLTIKISKTGTVYIVDIHKKIFTPGRETEEYFNTETRNKAELIKFIKENL